RRTHGCGRDYRFRRTRIVLDAERLFGELDAVQHDQLRQYLLDALYRRERQLTERIAHARRGVDRVAEELHQIVLERILGVALEVGPRERCLVELDAHGRE